MTMNHPIAITIDDETSARDLSLVHSINDDHVSVTSQTPPLPPDRSSSFLHQYDSPESPDDSLRFSDATFMTPPPPGSPAPSTMSSEIRFYLPDAIENDDHLTPLDDGGTEEERWTGVFDTMEDLVSWVKEEGARHNVAIAIKSSCKGRNVYLHCVCSGIYRTGKRARDDESSTDNQRTEESNLFDSEEEREPRKRTTNRQACPFLLYGTYLAKGLGPSREGAGKWHIKVRNSHHSHPPIDPVTFHQLRQLKENEKDWLRRQIANSWKPTARALLHSFEATFRGRLVPVTKADIQNFISAHWRQQRGSNDPINHTFHWLATLDCDYEVYTDNENRLSRLFIMHQSMKAQVARFPSLLMMDCTYKTNNLKLPLLQIVGVDCCEKTFIAAWTFLRRETEEDYLWAIEKFKFFIGQSVAIKVKTILTDNEVALTNALHQVLPNCRTFLCGWHINKNMQAKVVRTLLFFSYFFFGHQPQFFFFFQKAPATK